MQPAKVSGPTLILNNDRGRPSEHGSCNSVDSTTGDHRDNGENLCLSVMLSKPILAFEFSCLKMQVEAPTVVSPISRNS